LELILVLGLLAVISSLVLPTLIRDLEGSRLLVSSRQMRSLLELTRAKAQFEGKRYRLRIPGSDELDRMGTDRQPIVERTDDPLNPEEWTLVEEPWTLGEVFLEGVWCIQTRLGRPTVAKLRDPGPSMAEHVANMREEFDDNYPPVIFEPDGTAPWATFVVTRAPRDTTVEGLDDTIERIEVIMQGNTGMVWLQRPLYEEELNLFEENGWPIVLRKDFLDKRMLTEDDVLELPELEVSPQDGTVGP